MSKKILSMALAVVMLVSIFAFSANAAVTVDTVFPGAGQVGYRVVSDAYVGMPAGETVTVKVYYVLPTGTDYDTLRVSFTGNTYLSFTDAFTVNTDSRVWGDEYYYMKAAAQVNNSTAHKAASAKYNDDDKAMNWTDTVLVQKTLDTAAGSGYTATTGHPIAPYCELYSIEFTTTRTLTETDTIGIPAGCVGKTGSGAVIVGTKKPTNATLTAEDIIINEATAKADRVEVNDTATTKMRPGSADGKVDLGLTGTVMKTAFEPGKEKINGTWVAPNLNAVGVQVRKDGIVEDAQSGCIYELKDGREGFNYRVVITDMDVNDLGAEIEVRTYIKDVNGNTYFSNWMGIDATAAYEAKFGA